MTNVDLPPTVTDLAGFETPDAWQGRSLVPLLRDADAEWRDFIVVDHGLYTAQRAVVAPRWKYIRTYHPGLWGGVTPDTQLYDIENDPWEQADRAEQRPDVVRDLNGRMAVWAHARVGPHEDALHAVAREDPAGYRGTKDRYEGV